MLSLLLAAAAAAAGPRPAELRTFGDWTVACDNGRACAASALRPEEDYGAATGGLSRGAEANAAPVVWINVPEGVPAALLVNGRRFALREGPDAGYRAVDPAGLVAALAAGKKAVAVDSAGKPLGALSTAGISAALLYIDDKQGRLGNVTALLRKGRAPASAVPPAPPLPVVVAAPASAKRARKPTAAQVKAARREYACEDPSQEQPPESWRLDARYTLALVPVQCGSGAYNYMSVALLIDDSGRASAAKFEQTPGGEAQTDNDVYNADWDPKTRRLGTYFKGRGLGDCGTSQIFAWDGARFRLVEQTEMGECRGSMDFITTWRAAVRG